MEREPGSSSKNDSPPVTFKSGPKVNKPANPTGASPTSSTMGRSPTRKKGAGRPAAGPPTGRPLVKIGIAVLILGLGVAYYLGTRPPTAASNSASGVSSAPVSAAPVGPASGVSTARTEGQSSDASTGQSRGQAGKDSQADFVSGVLAETADAWRPIFKATGSAYDPPTPVLFSGGEPAVCGYAQVARGPFYCPQDGKLYLDVDFLRALRQRSPQSAGDFAAQYVIAHEVGHHVQNLLGNTDVVQQLLKTATDEEADTISVMAEMQADCYAGVWLKHAKPALHIFEQSDVDAGLAAASAAGKDLLGRQVKGDVVPDSFTHGTAEERTHWFTVGLASGNVQSCDTF